MIRKKGWLALALLVPLAGCASKGEQPRAEFREAEQAIEAAVGANGQEHAPMALREAREKLDQARNAADDGERDRARLLAAQAQTSAELALAQAETKRTEEVAQEAISGARTLRKELQREEATR